jgi:hypothetical protein
VPWLESRSLCIRYCFRFDLARSGAGLAALRLLCPGTAHRKHPSVGIELFGLCVGGSIAPLVAGTVGSISPGQIAKPDEQPPQANNPLPPSQSPQMGGGFGAEVIPGQSPRQ